MYLKLFGRKLMTPFWAEMLIWKATENDLISVEQGQNFDQIIVNNKNRHSIYCSSDELEITKYSGVLNKFFNSCLNARLPLHGFIGPQEMTEAKIKSAIEYMEKTSCVYNGKFVRMSDITGEDINFTDAIDFYYFKENFEKFKLSVSKLELLIKYLEKFDTQKSLVDFCKQQLIEQRHNVDLEKNKSTHDLDDKNASNSIKSSVE